MDRIELLRVALEYMFTSDEEEAAHALRAFANEIEKEGIPSRARLKEVLKNVLLDEEETFEDADSDFDEDVGFDSYSDNGTDEPGSLFDSYDDD